MNVQSILKAKGGGVVTTRADASVASAVNTLCSHRIGALVVTADDGTIEGIISERDIVFAIGERGRGVLDGSVAEIMTRTVVTCAPEDTVDSLMATMTHGRFRHLPVTAEGRLAGIVSIGDVVKHRMQELEEEAGALRDYIAS